MPHKISKSNEPCFGHVILKFDPRHALELLRKELCLRNFFCDVNLSNLSVRIGIFLPQVDMIFVSHVFQVGNTRPFFGLILKGLIEYLAHI